MAQFDLLRHGKNRRYPFVLDVQADLLRDLATRVVVPLTPVRQLRGKPIGRLNPVVALEGVQYAIAFQELAAVPADALGDVIGNLRNRREELVAALDLLFTGI
jgi:toxin CcdB